MVKKMTAMLLRYDYNGEYYIITKMSRAFFSQDDTQFGIDWNGPLPQCASDSATIFVEPPSLPISYQDFVELIMNDVINHTEACDDYGIHFYIKCIKFVQKRFD